MLAIIKNVRNNEETEFQYIMKNEVITSIYIVKIKLKVFLSLDKENARQEWCYFMYGLYLKGSSKIILRKEAGWKNRSSLCATLQVRRIRAEKEALYPEERK